MSDHADVVREALQRVRTAFGFALAEKNTLSMTEMRMIEPDLPSALAALDALVAETARLNEVIAAKNDLLTAYRIGSHAKADAALAKLEKLAARAALGETP